MTIKLLYYRRKYCFHFACVQFIDKFRVCIFAISLLLIPYRLACTPDKSYYLLYKLSYSSLPYDTRYAFSCIMSTNAGRTCLTPMTHIFLETIWPTESGMNTYAMETYPSMNGRHNMQSNPDRNVIDPDHVHDVVSSVSEAILDRNDVRVFQRVYEGTDNEANSWTTMLPLSQIAFMIASVRLRCPWSQTRVEGNITGSPFLTTYPILKFLHFSTTHPEKLVE